MIKTWEKLKNPFLILIMLSGLLFFSCTGNKSSTDQIVKSSVTNQDGIRLDMTYNNTKRTARFVLKGENIDLKQDTTASGIKYSNIHFEFNEWHGEVTLKKDGAVIFSNKK